MLKIVPDPPLNSLEDSLAVISEYLMCAHTITQQLVFLNPKQPMQAMGLAVMHEIEAARGLVERQAGYRPEMHRLSRPNRG